VEISQQAKNVKMLIYKLASPEMLEGFIGTLGYVFIAGVLVSATTVQLLL
jgi:hypothetical protein